MQQALIRRLSKSLVGAIIAVMVVAASAIADTPLGHSGTYARHQLADTQEYPGVRCFYDDDQNLNKVKAWDPSVYAFSNDPEARTVSWRFTVQQRVGSGAWLRIARSDWQLAEARTTRTADFSPMSLAVSANPAATVRVLVKMAWWVGGKSIGIVGTATHRVDWYKYPLADANHGFCPAAIL